MTWLDMLRTPMAAPETPWLKTMRIAILCLSGALAAGIVALRPMRDMFGAGMLGALAALMLALAVLVPVYVVTKNRADSIFLDEAIAGHADREKSA